MVFVYIGNINRNGFRNQPALGLCFRIKTIINHNQPNPGLLQFRISVQTDQFSGIVFTGHGTALFTGMEQGEDW
jgi:hypothetical protein